MVSHMLTFTLADNFSCWLYSLATVDVPTKKQVSEMTFQAATCRLVEGERQKYCVHTPNEPLSLKYRSFFPHLFTQKTFHKTCMMTQNY